MSAFYIYRFDCHNFTFFIILKVKSTCVHVILISIVQFLKGGRRHVDKNKSIYNMHSHNASSEVEEDAFCAVKGVCFAYVINSGK